MVIRRLKPRLVKGEPTPRLVVQVRSGTYFLKQALQFTPDDSGTADAPILYEAYPGESPLLSGGEPLVGAKKIATELPLARLVWVHFKRDNGFRVLYRRFAGFRG